MMAIARNGWALLVAVALTPVVVPGPAAAAPGVEIPSVPISSSLAEGANTWLVVPMGHLSQPLNTFWQLFVRGPATDGWATVTPPGVADNGGLVITPGAASTMVAGFLPSQDLTFSPLSVTTDRGRTWTGAYFPQGLAAVPDALARSAGGTTVGLGSSADGTVLETGPGQPSWRALTTLGALGRTAAGSRCGIERLTAVGVAANGDPVVGAACRRPGVVGLFDLAGPSPTLVGPTSTPGDLGRAVTVLRLMAAPGGPVVLLSVGAGRGARAMVTGWLGPGGSVTLSSPLVLSPSARPLATGTTGSGGAFVLIGGVPGAAPKLAEVAPRPSGRPAWGVVAPPPRGTLAATFSNGRIDAVTVHSSTLTDYVLSPGSAGWVRFQVLHVPIRYGSSG